METLDRHNDVMRYAVTLTFQSLSILLENSALVTEVKKSGYNEFSTQADRMAGTYTPANPIVAPHLAMNVKKITHKNNIATLLHNKH